MFDVKNVNIFNSGYVGEIVVAWRNFEKIIFNNIKPCVTVNQGERCLQNVEK